MEINLSNKKVQYLLYSAALCIYDRETHTGKKGGVEAKRNILYVHPIYLFFISIYQIT